MRPIGRALASSLIALVALAWLALPLASRAAAPAPAVGMHGMVVAAERHAAQAGLAMLRAGGNAIDAAVATSFALGVTEPYHSGLGGGGFLLIRLANGEVIALDARETAPAAASRDMFVASGVAKDASRTGPLAVATPGMLAGLALALERYGTKSL
ncbi:MAG: gamma-glutamyltransferase, partial [Proteobacteria bacterium]|nr:gamma-glutamyltransferase [Pseudomonadota bacterium]